MIQTLERRVLFALAVAITPAEQEMLTLLNRMRTDPAHELNLLIHSKDQDVNDAISFFNVDLKVLAQQWAQLLPAPPLAWNDILAAMIAVRNALKLRTKSAAAMSTTSASATSTAISAFRIGLRPAVRAPDRSAVCGSARAS